MMTMMIMMIMKLLTVRMWAGKKIHCGAPATDSDRSPNCKRVRGISSSLSFAERRDDNSSVVRNVTENQQIITQRDWSKPHHVVNVRRILTKSTDGQLCVSLKTDGQSLEYALTDGQSIRLLNDSRYQNCKK